jgi:drug/metabolite transporter (DMT)-like permease
MNQPSVWPVLLGTGVLLGAGIPVAKFAAAQGVGPLAFALWPTAAAGALLAVLAARRHGALALRLPLLRFGLIAGALGHALPMSALFWLSTRAGAGFSALAFTLPPVFTLAITLLLRFEAWQWQRAAAVAVGLAGALLLVGGRGGSFEPDALAVAVLLAIPALIGAANVYRARFLPREVPGEWLGALTLLSSTLLLALVAIGSASAPLPDGGAALGWLGVQTLALVGGYRLYVVLQRRAEPVTFSFMGYVTMATGVAAGIGWFGERLAWTTWPALALILAALWLVQRGGAAVPRLAVRSGA